MAGHDIDIEMRNTALVREKFEAWQAGKGSPLDLLADDARWTIVGRSMVAKTYDGRESFFREVIRPFNARMREGLKPSLRGVFSHGDQVIALFDGRAVTLDGQPYSNTYAWFMRLCAGKIVEATAFFDSIAFDELWRRVAPALDGVAQSRPPP